MWVYRPRQVVFAMSLDLQTAQIRNPVQISLDALGPSSLAVSYEIRYPLCNHHCGYIGVGSDAVRHYRCVNNPEILHSSYSSILINDTHII